MGLPITNTSPGRLPAALALFVAAALALLLQLPGDTRATSLATWQSELAADQQRLELLRDQLGETVDQLDAVQAERVATLRDLEGRLVSIYKANGVVGLDRVLAEGGVRRANDIADVVNTVSRHDAGELRRYERLSRRVPRLQKQIAALRVEIRAARQEVVLDKRSIRKKLREALARRISARRMARLAEVPLTPRAVSPETVATSMASPGGGAEKTQASSAQPAGYSESGIASVYADSFTGEPTASGELYDPGALTAAHQTLPLGTWVTVTGPAGSALIRINDRGPFVGGRIIDLSPAAAASVGVAGLGSVTITVQT